MKSECVPQDGCRTETDCILPYSKGRPWSPIKSLHLRRLGRPRKPVRRPQRFTIFLLKVKKLQLSQKCKSTPFAGSRSSLRMGRGRRIPQRWIRSNSTSTIAPYATAYSGKFVRIGTKSAKDLFASSRYAIRNPYFSGQEAQGFLVLSPPYIQMWRELRLKLEDVAIRFDFSGRSNRSASTSSILFFSGNWPDFIPMGTTRMSSR